MELYRKKQDMSKFNKHKLACVDLELILTQKCNFSCEHCMRGNCTNKEITEEVLDYLFEKFAYIDNLSLGGGEITLVPEKIKLVAQKLKEHKVIVHHSNFTSNGSIVNDEVLDALEELRDYVVSCKDLPDFFTSDKNEKNIPMFVCFSFDDYHLDQIQNHGISLEQLFGNIAKFSQRFGEDSIECRLESDIDVYDEGRAKQLPNSAHKVSMQKFLTAPYPFVNIKDQLLLLGNIVVISCDGEIIPANISFENEKAFSYGNIKTSSISQILTSMNAYETNDNGYNKARNQLFVSMKAPKKLIRKYQKIGNKKKTIFYHLLDVASQEMQ